MFLSREIETNVKETLKETNVAPKILVTYQKHSFKFIPKSISKFLHVLKI